MNVSKQDNEGSHFVIKDPDFTVTLLSGHAILFSNDLHQMFKNPRNTRYRNLRGVYPDLKAIAGSAECYTEGVTNKSRFGALLADRGFLERYSLSREDAEKISTFLTQTRYNPAMIREQLFIRGYGRVADALDIYDPLPELVESCKLFDEFIKYIIEKAL